MSGSPALAAQLSPNRSPSLSSAFPRSSSDAPSTPTIGNACAPHAPPTPPDSSSRIGLNTFPSPRSPSSPNTSSVTSLSTTLSAAAPQFQSRLLDTPIDIHELAPELESPIAGKETDKATSAADHDLIDTTREQSSLTPTPDGRVPLNVLPPAFVPAAVRTKAEQQPAPAKIAPTPTEEAGPHPPNVYINGLPPNFPEDDLLAMTRPFGKVLSVRTFTRHVSDKPSGYGFVLFEALDAAEKCIESLRKYRNLHPSFSKQVHKIPGTAYASAPAACNTGPADSFKSKMEQLRDTGSTNLYMEGLPLSVNEEALRALVAPYRIMSSRFFQTRLSNPPRVIAFVRLETRDAAEEIIERLHGRLVRGWNDVGCRISVRFADTAEQRELRRAERHGREDEQSPARLTMARAALLNMKGTQYQPDSRSPVLGDMASVSNPASPNLGLALNNLGLGQGGQASPFSGSSPFQVQGAFPAGLHGANLLVPNTTEFDMLNAQASHTPASDLRLPQQILTGGTNGLDEQAQLRLALLGMQGLRNSAQNGFTPVERLILQAHNRQQANAFGTKPDSSQDPRGVLGPRLSGLSSTTQEVSRRLCDLLPQMSEDDFHAAAGLLQDTRNASSSFQHAGTSAQPTIDAQAALLALGMERGLALSDTQARQRNHTLATQGRGDAAVQSAHARSSTLPSQYFATGTQDHAQHDVNLPLYDSGASLASHASPSIGTLRSNIMTNDPHIAISHKHNTVPSNSTINTQRNTNIHNHNAVTQTNTHTLFTSKSNINLPSSRSRPSVSNVVATPKSSPRTVASASVTGHTTRARSGSVTAELKARSTGIDRNHGQDADADDEGSPVVSPALTYSARTPASLSPATPYSGFFGEGGDAFRGPALGNRPGKDNTDVLPHKTLGGGEVQHVAAGGSVE
ncbi:hypothetical protein BD413DRAFT_466980 [Trametes elegans]|nr:hypothetical protein BD413DRAFT_466980 [Trametes elegans]